MVHRQAGQHRHGIEWPQTGAPQTGLDMPGKLTLVPHQPVDLCAIGDIVPDTGRKRVWLLCHPPKAAAVDGGVDIVAMNVFARHFDPSLDAHPAGFVMHPVEAFERRGFPATRWPDKGEDFAGVKIEGYRIQRLLFPVPKRQVADGQNGWGIAARMHMVRQGLRFGIEHADLQGRNRRLAGTFGSCVPPHFDLRQTAHRLHESFTKPLQRETAPQTCEAAQTRTGQCQCSLASTSAIASSISVLAVVAVICLAITSCAA